MGRVTTQPSSQTDGAEMDTEDNLCSMENVGDCVIRWVGKGRGIGLRVHAVDEKSVHHVAHTTLAGADDQAGGEDVKQCTATVSQQGH